MQKLLSLPPNLVQSFHELERVNRTDWFCTTVHKSQGSEYPAVILAAASAAPSLLVRGVLYTAITRARRLLILAGDDTVLAQMAANNKQQRRYSGLRRRLKEGYHEQ